MGKNFVHKSNREIDLERQDRFVFKNRVKSVYHEINTVKSVRR